jgi:hypothetical protein
MYTNSAGHGAMDAGDDGIQQGETASSPPSGGVIFEGVDNHLQTEGLFSVDRLIPTLAMAKATTSATTTVDSSQSFQKVPKVSGMKSPPPSSKKNSESRGFDRLLHLAELARQFSPVPMSPVRPFRP